jgi:hypothetical protein
MAPICVYGPPVEVPRCTINPVVVPPPEPAVHVKVTLCCAAARPAHAKSSSIARFMVLDYHHAQEPGRFLRFAYGTRSSIFRTSRQDGQYLTFRQEER